LGKAINLREHSGAQIAPEQCIAKSSWLVLEGTLSCGPVEAEVDSCMKQENDARGLVKNWRSYPGRERCVNTTGYMPSYVEWLTCLEMEQSVEALRSSNSEAAKPSSTKPATTEGRSER